MVGVAALVRHHAHDLVALHLGLEGTTDTAVGAGSDHAVLRLPHLDDALFHQCRGRAGLNAGTAGDALGVHEGFVLARRDLGAEAAAVDGQREGALYLLAGAHAAGADDALARIETEVGVGVVLLGVQVVFAAETVAHLAQPHGSGHVLQLAVAVGRAGQAVQRVVGDVQLHDVAAQLGQFPVLRRDLHAGFGRGGAGGRQATAAFDLHGAQAARAEGLEIVGGAQLRDVDIGQGRGAHDRGALGHRHLDTIDFQRDELFGQAGRGTVVFIRIEIVQHCSGLRPLSAADLRGNVSSRSAPGRASCHPSRRESRPPWFRRGPSATRGWPRDLRRHGCGRSPRRRG
ncbi:hypothetical protein FQZ97_649210 [compost metagenome]